jgi:hypothetical protein
MALAGRPAAPSASLMGHRVGAGQLSPHPWGSDQTETYRLDSRDSLHILAQILARALENLPSRKQIRPIAHV